MSSKDQIKEEYLLEVNNLKMHFDITTGFFKTTPLKAVDGVSFKIKKGETLGVVGESGCGKTTLGRTIMNLYKPSSGEILFDGVSISPYSDLVKIKKEKAFEIKSRTFEFKKACKIIVNKYNDDVCEVKKKYEDPSEDEKVKLEHEIANLTDDKDYKLRGLKEAYDEDILNIKDKYDSLYNAKKEEILAEIEKINLEKEQKLEALIVAEKDEESMKKCDEECLKISNQAKEVIAKAKIIKIEELAKAKDFKNTEMVKYRTFKEENKLALDNMKANSGTTQASIAKIKKSNEIEEIVLYEKIINEYKVLVSKAIGAYQETVRLVKEDEARLINKNRMECAYYNYIDSVKNINNEAKKKINDIKSSSKIRMKEFRRNCTMVFQDPYSSLNPRMTVADIIAEPLDVNKSYKTKEERRSMVLELMRKVGLSPEQSTRYAHEFSGGQRQRIGIARALAVNPKFIICDEPVSALDVSIQAQVINTFADLQKDLGLTYLFIAHDLLVVRHISDRIAVMYLGRVVELAETNDLYDSPLHPYTISLLSAVPMPDPKMARENKRIILEGDIPSPLNAPSGCPFRTRCPRACDRCANEVPKLTEVKPGHFVSCLLVQDELSK